MRKSLTLDAQKCIYYSLAYSHMIYGVSIWGGTYSKYLHRLIIIQKRLIRTMSNVDRRHHTAELFRDLKCLKFNNIYRYFISLLAYKCIRHNYVEGVCNPVAHQHRTRFAAFNMTLPWAPTNLTQMSVMYNTPKIWNSLPVELKNLLTLNSFKYNLKKYLLNIQQNEM